MPELLIGFTLAQYTYSPSLKPLLLSIDWLVWNKYNICGDNKNGWHLLSSSYVPGTFHTSFHLITGKPYVVGTTSVPIFQNKQLRNKKMQQFIQCQEICIRAYIQNNNNWYLLRVYYTPETKCIPYVNLFLSSQWPCDTGTVIWQMKRLQQRTV